MPSPFPGMDPFLEDPRWFGGLHGDLITFAKDAIQRVLPENYTASSGEHVWIAGPRDRREPDFDVVRQGPVVHPADDRGTAVLVPPVAAGARPTVVTVPDLTRRQGYVEIVRRGDWEEQVVAVFEVLSPGNKRPGDGRTQYLRKQHEVRVTDCHLIEIDLLRGHPPVSLLPGQWRERYAGPLDYHAVVTRNDLRTRYEIYPVGLREALPTISVPLLWDEGAVPLDLGAVFERAYAAGGYAKRVDYGSPDAVRPPLSPADAAWAAELVAGRAGGAGA